MRMHVGTDRTWLGQTAPELPNAVRPEVQLLLCSARMHLERGFADRIQSLIHQGVDWSYLVRLAAHHKVLPLLYRSLETYRSNIPGQVLGHLHAYYCANAKRNLYITAELVKIIERLNEHGISVIPYKGPAIAVMAYGNVGLRQFSDLDLLVHERDYFRTRSLFLKYGYRLQNDWGWECSLFDERHKLYVDLHRSFSPKEFPLHIAFEHLYKRLQPLPVATRKIDTLSAEDMLITLCVQLVKDGWGVGPLRLSKVCDIAELLRARADMDWPWVLQETERLGCRRMLLLGFVVAQRLLDAPIPRLSVKPSARYLNVLSAHLYHRLLPEIEPHSSASLTPAGFHFKVRERWRDKLYPGYRNCKSRLIPNEKDQAFLALPQWLNSVYYVIRPLRLLKEYGLSLGAVLRKKWLTLKNWR